MSNVTGLPTYRAEICVGIYPGYLKEGDPQLTDKEIDERCMVVLALCREYCDEVGLGLTVTDTTLVYTGGSEPGFLIGLVDYPRFPSGRDKVRNHAFALAMMLLKALHQERLTVVCTDATYLVEA